MLRLAVIYSELLEQKIKLKPVLTMSGRRMKEAYGAICDDGTIYTPAELALLGSEELPIEVHLLKKVFDGELVASSKPKTSLPHWWNKEKTK